jgi:hypothetical protein
VVRIQLLKKGGGVKSLRIILDISVMCCISWLKNQDRKITGVRRVFKSKLNNLRQTQ